MVGSAGDTVMADAGATCPARPSQRPQRPRVQSFNTSAYSLEWDTQEAGGDRPRPAHGHRAGRVRDRVASVPAGENVEESWSRRQGHHRAAVVASRAGRPAVDRSVVRGHGATAETRLVDVEREAQHVE